MNLMWLGLAVLAIAIAAAGIAYRRQLDRRLRRAERQRRRLEEQRAWEAAQARSNQPKSRATR
jgi:type II secretory pathway pseudopilin PulG